MKRLLLNDPELDRARTDFCRRPCGHRSQGQKTLAEYQKPLVLIVRSFPREVVIPARVSPGLPLWRIRRLLRKFVWNLDCVPIRPQSLRYTRISPSDLLFCISHALQLYSFVRRCASFWVSKTSWSDRHATDSPQMPRVLPNFPADTV